MDHVLSLSGVDSGEMSGLPYVRDRQTRLKDNAAIGKPGSLRNSGRSQPV
jgi:hypothetical protein